MSWGQPGGSTREFSDGSHNPLPLLGFAVFCLLTPTSAAFSQESSGASGSTTESAASNSQSGGRRFDPGAVHQSYQRLKATLAVGVVSAGAASGQRSSERGCSEGVPFEPSPEPLARYAGAAWLSWPGGSSSGAIMSEDDGARRTRGYRNRWRYTITGPAGVGLPTGCQLRLVTVRALVGGLVAVDLDRTRLLILPGDPEAQDRLSRVAPVCESNRQLVSVEEVGGRWRITIEEPEWLPWSRARC